MPPSKLFPYRRRTIATITHKHFILTMINIFICSTLPKCLCLYLLSFLYACAVFEVVKFFINAKILKPRVKDRSCHFPSCCMRFCTPPHQSLHKHCVAILKFWDLKCSTSWKYKVNISQNQLRMFEVTSANCLNFGPFIIAVLDVTWTDNNVT